MKDKILSAIVAVLAFSFGTYVYNFPPIKDVVTKPGTKIPRNPPINENDICNDYSSEKKSKLTNGLVHDMVQMYRKNQLANIQGFTTNAIVNDAQSIWFDLDTIKKFIYHFEHDIKQNATYANNKKGIRIYYAAYPEDIRSWKTKNEYRDIAFMSDDPTKSQYEKKHTLVMIPTLQNSQGEIYDINLFEPSTFATGIVRKNNVNDANVMKAAFRPLAVYSMMAGPNSTAQRATVADRVAARNHGTLTPPSTGNTGF